METKCDNCNKEISVLPKHLKFKKHFCDRNCQSEFGRYRFKCSVCQASAVRIKAQKIKNNCCSKECYRKKFFIIKPCAVCKKEISTARYSIVKTCSAECSSSLRAFAKLSYKNPMWAGEKVKLAALHNWVTRRRPKPDLCEECRIIPPKDLANISQQYKRDVADWEWLCRRCHMVKDGRLNKLHPNYEYKIMPAM